MSEMLANRYFLTGRFEEAGYEFSKLLEASPHRAAIRMRLVVCNTMMERLKEALELAVDIFQDSPEAVRVDPRIDGPSCKEAMSQLQERAKAMTPGMYHLSLGLLQLFCNEPQALEELNIALEKSPSFNEVRRLRALVERHLEAGHV